VGAAACRAHRRALTSLARRAERGEHLPHARHCNAMSISQSTGIPRETVRRKIRQLVTKGWLRKAGPDKLIVTSLPARHFAEFDLETLAHFYSAAQEILRLVEKRSQS